MVWGTTQTTRSYRLKGGFRYPNQADRSTMITSLPHTSNTCSPLSLLQESFGGSAHMISRTIAVLWGVRTKLHQPSAPLPKDGGGRARAAFCPSHWTGLTPCSYIGTLSLTRERERLGGKGLRGNPAGPARQWGWVRIAWSPAIANSFRAER